MPHDKLETPDTYTVLSDNFGKPGDVLTEDDLSALNITALIEGGHLARVTRPPAETKEQ